jgi:hypothetical protein
MGRFTGTAPHPGIVHSLTLHILHHALLLNRFTCYVSGSKILNVLPVPTSLWTSIFP